MTRRLLFVTLGAMLLVACRCGGDADPGPAIPEPQLAEMEPRVAEVLGNARKRVLDDPRSADAWGELGSLFDAHSLFDDAEVCYRRAQELSPDDFRWIYLLAVAHEINGGKDTDVEKLFLEAAGLRPDYAPLLIRLGDAYARAGRYEDAKRELERGLELVPDTAVAHRALGRALLSLGQSEDAIEHLERAIRLEPRDLAAHSALSQAYARNGREEDARRIVEQSAGLEPVSALDDPVFERWVFSRSVSSSRAFRRAMARIRNGDTDAAIADLQLVLEARPEHAASMHYWLGVAHAQAGREELAIEHYRAALSRAPRMEDAQLALEDLLRDEP